MTTRLTRFRSLQATHTTAVGIALALALAIVILFARQSDAAGQTDDPIFVPLVVGGPQTGLETLEQEALDAINAERAAHGCGALRSDERLQRAAERHSADMAAHNFLSHTGSDGSSPWDRIHDEGYRFNNAAENAAAGYPTGTDVVAGWMGSSGHRANILNCALDDAGIAHAYRSTTTYGHYWTLVMASGG